MRCHLAAGYPALLLAAVCLIHVAGAQGECLAPGRHLLQQLPTNCSAPGDSWTRTAMNCTVPPSYSVECTVAVLPAPAGTVQCQVYNDDKPNIRTAMTCPITQCSALCDLVVMQNFFPADLVFATAELLAAWKPIAPGC